MSTLSKRDAMALAADLREAANAGYMAACRDVYALVEETLKSSTMLDDFTSGRCFEAKGIARTMNSLGTDSAELQKALGELMRAGSPKTTPARHESPYDRELARMTPEQRAKATGGAA